MTITEAKKHLNKFVKYEGGDNIYKLTACILRKDKNGLFYRVELLDTINGNSVLIAGLDDITPAE